MINGQRHWVISGGIGSGKSAVRRLFADNGFATIDADSVGHEVLRSHGPAFAAVAARWPAVVVDGEIDRSALADSVFADQDELRELERITHPHIFGMIRDRVEKIDGVVFVEIPLLEHGLGSPWRRLVVDCADHIRLDRLVGKGMEESDARSRMAAQPTRGEWLASADVVVPNHRDLGHLESTVQEITSRL